MARRSCKRSKNCGFSLVEAIAVICLISILASGSVVLLGGSFSQARTRASLQRVLDLHHQACRESRVVPIELRFDLDHQTTELRARSIVTQALELPESLRISKLVVGGAVLESKAQTIEYQSGGCETYAILVGSVNAKQKWYVFSGATGKVEVIENEQATEAGLVQWQTRWTNAH